MYIRKTNTNGRLKKKKKLLVFVGWQSSRGRLTRFVAALLVKVGVTRKVGVESVNMDWRLEKVCV